MLRLCPSPVTLSACLKEVIYIYVCTHIYIDIYMYIYIKFYDMI